MFYKSHVNVGRLSRLCRPEARTPHAPHTDWQDNGSEGLAPRGAPAGLRPYPHLRSARRRRWPAVAAAEVSSPIRCEPEKAGRRRNGRSECRTINASLSMLTHNDHYVIMLELRRNLCMALGRDQELRNKSIKISPSLSTCFMSDNNPIITYVRPMSCKEPKFKPGNVVITLINVRFYYYKYMDVIGIPNYVTKIYTYLGRYLPISKISRVAGNMQFVGVTGTQYHQYD